MMLGRWNAMFQLFGSRIVNLIFWAFTNNYESILSPLSFFQIDNTFVGNDTLTNEP